MAAVIVDMYGKDAHAIAAGQAAHLAAADQEMAARWVMIADAIEQS